MWQWAIDISPMAVHSCTCYESGMYTTPRSHSQPDNSSKGIYIAIQLKRWCNLAVMMLSFPCAI